MSCTDKQIALIEKVLEQLRAAHSFTKWTTLNTHLLYLKKKIEVDKSIAATEEEMKSTLDSVEAVDDKSSAYAKWAELNTQLNQLVTRKAELEEEEIESKQIDAILKSEAKCY